MENWITTKVSCSNPDVAKAFALACSYPDEARGEEWDDLDTEYSITILDYIPCEEIKEISIRFPDDVIKCCFSYGADGCAEHHIVEYRNGEGKKVDIEPNYSFTLISIDFDKFNDLQNIYNKAATFFRRLDTTDIDKEGNMFLNWVSDEVCYKFEYDGAKGVKFKAEATKCRDQIDLKLYEGMPKYYWREFDPVNPKVMHNPLYGEELL